MLRDKIVIKMRCEKHRGYDPQREGESGIRGACIKCLDLLRIAGMMANLRERIAEVEED